MASFSYLGFVVDKDIKDILLSSADHLVFWLEHF